VALKVRHYLEDYDDPAEAHAAYLADLTARRKAGDRAAYIAEIIVTAMADHADRLRAAFARDAVWKDLGGPWHPARTLIFVGDNGGRFTNRDFGLDVALCFDLDRLLRLVLFAYTVGFDGADVMAQGLASFLLMSVAVPRNEPFPDIVRVFDAAAAHAPRVLGDLISIVGDFLLFHELGHTYVRHRGDDFLKVIYELPADLAPTPDVIRDIRLHDTGPVFNGIDRDGTQNGVLLVHPKTRHWREEHACDVFAMHALLAASADDQPGHRELDYLADILTVWQLVLFALGTQQDYLLRIDGASDADFDHPRGHMRLDIMIFHINYFAEAFAPDWTSPGLTRFKAHYDQLWSKDLQTLIGTGIELVRYAFDEEGPHRSELQTFTGAPAPPRGSALARFHEFALGPFLDTVRATTWSGATLELRSKLSEHLRSWTVNDQPVLAQLGIALHDVGIRLISEGRK
jgi:hypothetical protein